MNPDHHLYRDKTTGPWLVKLTIPARLKDVFGKAKFTKSTGTSDIRLARKLRDQWLPVWQNQIDTANPIDSLLEGLTGRDLIMATEGLRNTAVDIAQETGDRTLLDHLDRKDDALDRFLDRYIAHIARNMKPYSVEQYRKELPSLFKAFAYEGDIKNRNTVMNRVEAMGGNHNTQRRRLAIWRNYIERYQIYSATERDLLSLFTGHKFRAPKNYEGREPFEDSEVQLLLSNSANLPRTPLRDFILVALYSGMRLSEIASFSVEDGWVIVKDAKTRAGNRRIPIHSAILDSVTRLKSAKNIRPATIGQAFTGLRNKLELPRNKTFHSLRHTFVARLSAAGVPPHVLSALAGHAQDNFTLRVYSGTIPDDQLIDAISRLEGPQ